MIIAAHQTMLAPQGAPLPYDAEVEYVESTGTQYIDTGVIPTLSDAVSVDADMVLTTIKTNDNNILFGSYYDNNVAGSSTVFQSRLFAFVDSSRKARIAYGGAASGTVAVSAGERLAVSAQFAAGNSRLLVNGVQSSSRTSSPTVLPNIAIWIFRAAYGISTTTVSPCSARLYSLTITVNGALLRSFVPVRVGSVGYLFDRVSGQLFGNAGTGDFVLGPDTFQQGVIPTRMMVAGVRKKLPYDKDIEYIEINGDGAFIDTGVTPQNSPSATIRAQYLGTGQSSAAAMPLFGVRNYTNPMKAMNFFVQSSTMKLAVNYSARDTGWQTQTTNKTAFHDFGVSSTGGTYDGTQFVSFSESVADTGISCLVGAVHQANVTESVITRQVKFRIASFALYNGGVLAFDGIAVRKGTVGYLYDKVSKRLFGNAGTGSFVLGPDK